MSWGSTSGTAYGYSPHPTSNMMVTVPAQYANLYLSWYTCSLYTSLYWMSSLAFPTLCIGRPGFVSPTHMTRLAWSVAAAPMTPNEGRGSQAHADTALTAGYPLPCTLVSSNSGVSLIDLSTLQWGVLGGHTLFGVCCVMWSPRGHNMHADSR